MSSTVFVTVANLIMKSAVERALSTYQSLIPFWEKSLDDTVHDRLLLWNQVQDCHSHLGIKISIQFIYSWGSDRQQTTIPIQTQGSHTMRMVCWQHYTWMYVHTLYFVKSTHTRTHTHTTHIHRFLDFQSHTTPWPTVTRTLIHCHDVQSAVHWCTYQRQRGVEEVHTYVAQTVKKMVTPEAYIARD